MVRNFILAGVAAFVSFSAASAVEVTWNYNGQAGASGDCYYNSQDPFGSDVQFISSGKDLSVLFGTLGVELNGATGLNAARKRCNIRVPMLISRGVYLAQLTQVLNFGVVKSANSTVDISTSVKISTDLGAMAGPKIREYIGNGVMNNSAISKPSKPFLFSVNAPAWCGWGKSTINGMLGMDAAVSATRKNDSEYVITQIDGTDFRWEAIAGWYYCDQRGYQN